MKNREAKEEPESDKEIGDESRGSKESRYMKTECYSEMRSHWRVLSREVIGSDSHFKKILD